MSQNTCLHISGPKDFAQAFEVSRETLEKLEAYEVLLKQWQKSKNLIAPSTVDEIWHRHFADSAQLIHHVAPQTNTILDFGTGAGFPGLILAIMSKDQPANHISKVHLVESNAKKCAFLREVVRKLGLNITQGQKASGFVEIHNCRIEKLHESAQDINIDIITARACAPLEKLLTYAHPLFRDQTYALFLKGADLKKEITNAKQNWNFIDHQFQSRTEATGKILKICNVSAKSSA